VSGEFWPWVAGIVIVFIVLLLALRTRMLDFAALRRVDSLLSLLLSRALWWRRSLEHHRPIFLPQTQSFNLREIRRKLAERNEERLKLSTDEAGIVSQLRLDAALPSQVECNRSFRLAVAIRQLDSPKLQVEKLDQVVSDEEMEVVWPKGADSIALRVEVRAPECTIDRDCRSLPLYKGRDSRPLFFQLTPQKSGEINILVTVYQELEWAERENWLGDMPIGTVAQERLAGGVEITVISQPVGPSHQAKVAVANFIGTLFSLSEINTDLCKQLNILYEDIRGETRSEKAWELVQYTVRNGRFHELIAVCQELRPDVNLVA
jgi:hypothetical protein